jgi:hypothetical protein
MKYEYVELIFSVLARKICGAEKQEQSCKTGAIIQLCLPRLGYVPLWLALLLGCVCVCISDEKEATAVASLFKPLSSRTLWSTVHAHRQGGNPVPALPSFRDVDQTIMACLPACCLSPSPAFGRRGCVRDGIRCRVRDGAPITTWHGYERQINEKGPTSLVPFRRFFPLSFFLGTWRP